MIEYICAICNKVIKEKKTWASCQCVKPQKIANKNA